MNISKSHDKLKLEKSKIMKLIVEALEPVAIEVLIGVSEDGFRAQAVNESNVWIVDINLPSGVFDEIKISEARMLRINMKDLADFIRTARSDETLEIIMTDEIVELKLISENITKEIALRLLDMVEGSRFIDIGARQFHSSVEMDAGLFNDAIRVATLGEELVVLNNSKTGLEFLATSENRAREARAYIPYNNAEVKNVVIDEGKEYYDRIKGEDSLVPSVVSAKYNLNYLKQSAKVGKSGDSLKFSMDHAGPIRISFPIDDDASSISFAITPIKEEEEFNN
jgi:DNA polymerase III sliding clamp (beta) subunit (PCNA family)